MFLDDDGPSTNTVDPWGSLSGSGNSDPSWDGEATGGSDTVTGGGSDTVTGGGGGSYTGGGSEESVFDPTSIYEITNTATTPGAAGYGWKYYSDGTSISPDGKYYHQGEMVYDVNNPEQGTISKLLGKDVAKALKSKFVNADGSPNLAGIGAIGMTLYGLANKDKQGGYNKPVPKMDVVREQIQYNDPNRRPGEAGRQYFTDPRFAAQGNAEALAAAKTASSGQASGIQAAYKAATAQGANPWAGKMKMGYNPQPVTNTGEKNTATTSAGLPAIPTQLNAQGGLPIASAQSSTSEDQIKADAFRRQQEEDRVVSALPIEPSSEVIFNPNFGEGYKEAVNKNALDAKMADPEYKRLYDAARASRGDRMTMEITPEEQALNRYSGGSKSYPQQENTMAGLEAAAKASMGAAPNNPAPAGSVAPDINYPEKTFSNPSVISNPAEKAMQERLNAPIRPQNPQDFGGPGMIKNPEYLARNTGPDQIMDMRYVPEYISSNPSASFDFSKIPMPLAKGGLADAGRYLQGETDGMADKIPSSIDGEQPAALSHGEFVIPADVVSHLGNGNSDAGAQKLYEMMDRIRQARTGTKEQGKQINPDEFTMGGLAAAYAGGGAVKGFDGTTGSAVTPNPISTGAGGTPQDVSRTSTLSPWVGDYVTNALSQGAALAAAPYQAYQGPLTAGASNLQQQAFAGASEMAQAGYTPGQFTNTFTSDVARQYMNPYLQASLDPQLKELQRSSDIARLSDAGRLTKAGAYGGSRQAIMESEGRRNLLDKQQDVLGTGYKTAYDLARQQYAKDRGDEEASRQFGANFGMKSIDQLSGLGAIERGITSEGIAADKAQFEEQRDFAYGMPKYQLGLLSGLPIGANTTSVDQDALGRLNSTISGLGASYKTIDAALRALGVTGGAGATGATGGTGATG